MTDQIVQLLMAERDKLNRDLSSFQFYPVISIGFGFNF